MNFTQFKILTLSCLFARSLASLNAATSLEEAIKDVEVSGVMRYRYDTGRFENRSKLGFRDAGDGQYAGRGLVASSQAHRMLANFGFKASIGDDIKVFSQLWFSYLDESAFLYALNVNFKGKFSDEASFNVESSYLGNSLNKAS